MKKLKLPKFHWAKLLSIFFFVILLGAYANIFAVGEPYAPGTMLDPTCGPLDPDCTVSINPSQWLTTGNNISYTNGNVGIGTTTSAQNLNIAGNININTNGTNALFSTYQGDNSDGDNIWIGGGGQNSIGEIDATYKGSSNTAYGYQSLYSNTTGFSNTANGNLSLFFNTTGVANTANGYQSLYSNTTGNGNTTNGYQSLYSNTTGGYNTANGFQSLYSNTTGTANTANGNNSLYSNTTGYYNTANGIGSLSSNTTGYYNTANGHGSLSSNTTGNYNTANGAGSLQSNTTGIENTANGYISLYSNTTGSNNTANGNVSLFSNTTGNFNTANGFASLVSNTTGSANTANGMSSLNYNTTGSYNTANGNESLYLNTTGGQNTANGFQSLYYNTTGTYNIGLGYEAGHYISGGAIANTTGDYNVFLGSKTQALADDDQNEIVIGYNAIGNGSNTATIGNTSTLRTYLTGLNLKAGTATAGTAPLKFTSSAGALLGTTEAGAMEYDGTNLYFTPTGTTRKTIAYTSDLSNMVYPASGIPNSTGSAWGVSYTTSGTGTELALTNSPVFTTPSLGVATATSINNLPLSQDNTDFNVKVGQDAGLNLVSGAQYNTFLGYEAGKSGAGTSTNATDNNTAVGYQSLYFNTTGSENTANGSYSLYSNTTGNYNTANGLQSLYSNTTGYFNTANGNQSLYSNTTGTHNTANGALSLFSNTTGSENTANGIQSLYSNTTGYSNTANGALSLNFNTTGTYNTANGANSLLYNTTGFLNTANGAHSLVFNTEGSRNTANGSYSLYFNTEGSQNTANGVNSLYNNTNGTYNIGLGYEAGRYISGGVTANTTGDYNIFIGSNTKALADNDQNEIVIGYNTTGKGSNTTTIGTGNVLYVGGGSVTGMVARFTNSTGSCDINPTTASIGCSSDIRLKKNITTLNGEDFILNTEIKNTKIDEATLEETNKTVLEKLISLNPVKYNWNIEDYQVDENGNDNKHIGFIAQEMEQIFPDLVATDEKTGLKSIFYTNLIPYTIEAIQEMNLKVEDLSSLDVTKATSLGSLIKSFLVDQVVLIRELTVNKLNIDGEVCVDDVCITKEQFKQMIITASGADNSGNNNDTATPPVPPVVTPLVNNPDGTLTPEEIETQRLADLETERLANEKVTADRLETERLAKEAEDKAIADKAEADRIEAERIAAELEAQKKSEIPAE